MSKVGAIYKLMQKTFSTVWVSSIEHMNSFNEISSSNSIWKVLLFLNKVPSDFPQMKSVGRILPIVYFAKGMLQIFEREIDFKAEPIFYDSGPVLTKPFSSHLKPLSLSK